MVIRKMTPEDRIQYMGICSTVFLSMDRVDTRAQLKDPQAHKKEDDGNDYWGAFDAKGKMHSAMSVIHYNMLMNGNVVKMGGISGVVTRPESRGQGLIRKIFDVAFPAMLENGQTFSYLYPFSYGYYRKFGYEICNTSNNVNIPIAEMQGYSYPKTIEPFEPGDDVAPYAEIYEEFTRDRNLAIVRNKDAWKRMLDRDPYKNLQFTFLNRDADGKGDAYILYETYKASGDGNRLKVKELCWRTLEGLHSIWGFLARLGAECESVEWNAPYDVNVHALFPEAYNVSWKKGAGGMNCILDVSAGLSTLRAPNGNGQLTFDIVDNYQKANSGIYTIQWESGNITACKTTESNIAMATDVQTLAQLVTGYLSPEEAALKKSTTVYNSHLQLCQLFPKQKLHMTEGF